MRKKKGKGKKITKEYDKIVFKYICSNNKYKHLTCLLKD